MGILHATMGILLTTMGILLAIWELYDPKLSTGYQQFFKVANYQKKGLLTGYWKLQTGDYYARNIYLTDRT